MLFSDLRRAVLMIEHEFDIEATRSQRWIFGGGRTREAAVTSADSPMSRSHDRQLVLAATVFAVLAGGCAIDVELSSAVNRGDVAAVQALVAAGHDPNATLAEGWTPLTVASSAGDVRLVTLLLDAGADVNRTKNAWLNQDGRTPLHWAAAGRHLAVVVLLVERGAQVHAADAEGRTALHAGARGGSPEVVAQLLRHGASSDARDNQGWTPLMLAAGSEEGGRASGVAQALLQASNNVTAVDPRGRSALHWAASTASAEFVGTLITFGAEVDRRTVDGDTALWWAAAKGNDAVVSRLLDAGADRSLARIGGAGAEVEVRAGRDYGSRLVAREVLARRSRRSAHVKRHDVADDTRRLHPLG